MRDKTISKFAAREAMQRHGYDPIEELVGAALDPNTGGEVKREIAMFLMPYTYPKLANVAIESDNAASNTSLTQEEMMLRIFDNPELCDAAQRLSLVAAEIFLDNDKSSGSVQ